MRRSAKITKVFIKIPIAIEKTTNPFLYSFFQGRKNVLMRSGKDSNERSDLFNEMKNLIILTGASIYQNFRKVKGRVK